jgi:hypothetical protein
MNMAGAHERQQAELPSTLTNEPASRSKVPGSGSMNRLQPHFQERRAMEPQGCIDGGSRKKISSRERRYNPIPGCAPGGFGRAARLISGISAAWPAETSPPFAGSRERHLVDGYAAPPTAGRMSLFGLMSMFSRELPSMVPETQEASKRGRSKPSRCRIRYGHIAGWNAARWVVRHHPSDQQTPQSCPSTTTP